MNYELAARLEALSALADGWHDGCGLAPKREGLAVVSEGILEHFPEGVPLPAVVPTPEGNLLLEWDLPGVPSIDFDLTDRRAHYHAFLPDESEAECWFQLTGDEAWSELFAFLQESLQQLAA